jgi:ethanolamine ammonia-lyase small subunit
MNRPDAWNPLREFTDARIALGAAAPACRPAKSSTLVWPTPERGMPFISRSPASSWWRRWRRSASTLTVHSAAPDRHTYLRRPDLGRQLADESRADLAASGVRPADLLLVIGDGLSSWAVERQAVPLIRALLPYLQTLGIGLAPVVLAHQSRVALGMILAKP